MKTLRINVLYIRSSFSLSGKFLTTDLISLWVYSDFLFFRDSVLGLSRNSFQVSSFIFSLYFIVYAITVVPVFYLFLPYSGNLHTVVHDHG